MARVKRMWMPEVGHYSEQRTRRGNVQVGRLHGKSNLRIVRDMIGITNLNKGRRTKRKFVSTGKLALTMQARKL